MTIKDAEKKQKEFYSIVDALNNYFPKAQKYIEAKNTLLNNVKKFCKGREKIIEGFKEGIFLLKSDGEFEQQQTSKKPIKTDIDEFSKYIAEEEAHINKELFIKHFYYQKPSDMLNHLYETNDINNSNKLVSVIFSGIRLKKRN